MKALKMREVTARYPGADRDSLSRVSFEIEKGEMVLLLGARGAGKSTLCMLTNGLVPHAIPCDLEGSIETFGRDISSLSVAEHSEKVGIVFQEPESQLFCMSVEEEVAFGPENLAVDRGEISERVEWALEIVGLKGCNDRPPSSLSGGQKQRLAIAAALSMRPEMLVLDEPAYALDPIGRVELYSLLTELKRRHGLTVLIAGRDAEEAATSVDRVAVMSAGRLVRTGTPAEVLTAPETLRSVGVPPLQLSELTEALGKKTGRFEYRGITVEALAGQIGRALGEARASR